MSTSATSRPFVAHVVTDHPKDFPDKFVVRMHVASGGRLFATNSYRTYDTIQQVREQMAMHGLVRLPRHPDDDPVIVETWV